MSEALSIIEIEFYSGIAAGFKHCLDMNCNICVEDFSPKGETAAILCQYCDFAACRACCKRYIIEGSSIKCMRKECGRTWSRKFIDQSFPKSFILGELKEWRERNLFNSERARFPETAPIAAIEKQVEQCYSLHLQYKKHTQTLQARLDQISSQVKLGLVVDSCFKCSGELTSTGKCLKCKQYSCQFCFRLDPKFHGKCDPYGYRHLLSESDRNFIQAHVDVVNQSREMARLFLHRSSLSTLIEDHCFIGRHDFEIDQELTGTRKYNRLQDPDAVVAEPRPLTNKCRVNGCQGFLSSQWKCGTCNNWTCKDCHEVKGEKRDNPHKCDPRTIETVKLLKADTKPCPKCREGISKISGCDHMWCTLCKTAFSWRTGEITKTTTNPHYYEYMRSQGIPIPRAGGQPNNCDVVVINVRLVEQVFRRNFLSKDFDLFNDYYLSLQHFIGLEVPEYRRKAAEVSNQDLRIKYINNLITEADFMKQLQMRSKSQEKFTEILDIVVLFSAELQRILLLLEADIKEGRVENVHQYLFVDIPKLHKHCNSLLSEVSQVFGSVLMKIYIMKDGMPARLARGNDQASSRGDDHP